MTTAVPDPIATSGIDLLRWAQQQSPDDLPTIDRLIGMRLDRVEPGDIAISVETRSEFSNPLGTVHGGISATLLDSALGCAVHSLLPAGTL